MARLAAADLLAVFMETESPLAPLLARAPSVAT
jgi:hypothetical protein